MSARAARREQLAARRKEAGRILRVTDMSRPPPSGVGYLPPESPVKCSAPRLLIVLVVLLACAPPLSAYGAPRVFVWDAKALAAAKGRIDGDLKPAFERLKGDADKALKVKPRS